MAKVRRTRRRAGRAGSTAKTRMSRMPDPERPEWTGRAAPPVITPWVGGGGRGASRRTMPAGHRERERHHRARRPPVRSVGGQPVGEHVGRRAGRRTSEVPRSRPGQPAEVLEVLLNSGRSRPRLARSDASCVRGGVGRQQRASRGRRRAARGRTTRSPCTAARAPRWRPGEHLRRMPCSAPAPGLAASARSRDRRRAW